MCSIESDHLPSVCAALRGVTGRLELDSTTSTAGSEVLTTTSTAGTEVLTVLSDITTRHVFMYFMYFMYFVDKLGLLVCSTILSVQLQQF